MSSVARLASFACCLLTAQPISLNAQAVHGRIVDIVGQPLRGVKLVLYRDSTLTAATTSDSAGRFQLVVRDAGNYRLSAALLGYAVNERNVAVSQDDVELTLTLTVDAVKLAPVTVEASNLAMRHRATFEGFLARRQSAKPIGNERVVLRNDPEMANENKVSDVLRWFPPPRCLAVFLDGKPQLNWRFLLEFPVAQLAGLEYYRYELFAPLEYRATGACVAQATYSVLAIWTAR